MEQQSLTVTAGTRLTQKGKKSRVGWEPFRTILLIMLNSGLRPGEVFRTRWENIHWDKSVIFNPRGNQSGKPVPPHESSGQQFRCRSVGVWRRLRGTS
jgi:integrase